MIGLLQRVLMPPLVIVAMLAFALPFAAIAIPVAIIFAVFSAIRERWVVTRAFCPSCSRVLGLDSLRLGREDCRLEKLNYGRKYPGGERTTVGHHPAICVHCGARLQTLRGSLH